jgi:hypothetical protein
MDTRLEVEFRVTELPAHTVVAEAVTLTVGAGITEITTGMVIGFVQPLVAVKVYW